MFQDLRRALRMLVQTKVWTAVVLLTLALGIGANTATFSAVDAVLLRPLPYPDPDKLVMVWEKRPAHGQRALGKDSSRRSVQLLGVPLQELEPNRRLVVIAARCGVLAPPAVNLLRGLAGLGGLGVHLVLKHLVAFCELHRVLLLCVVNPLPPE